MALTRKMLSAMGIESDKIDQIIESHTETVDGLKKQAEEYRDKAAKASELEKELEELKAAQPSEDLQTKYDKLKAEYDEYKNSVADEKAKREKADLYRALLKEAGIDEKRLASIMKVTDLSKIEVKDGAIKDADSVKKAVADEWGDFIVQKATQGAKVEEPPNNTGGKMTKEQILAIKDTHTRQQAIADNFELFQ